MAKLADRLLASLVVDSLKSVSGSFRGVAVTRGRLPTGPRASCRRLSGGGERLLEELGRREGSWPPPSVPTSEREARASVEARPR